MEEYKERFIDFLTETGALKLGEFTLKSGRKSPYFINTGSFNDGRSISRLGYFYASRLMQETAEFDVLFGPAYNGIPLALATSISLANDFHVVKGFSFNRKEAKEHGEKGVFVGHKIENSDRIVILDDVFTTGKTKVEAVELLREHADVSFPCVLIAVDRQEVGAEGKSAIREFEGEFDIPVMSIVTVREIIDYLSSKGEIDDDTKGKMEGYLEEYGVK